MAGGQDVKLNKMPKAADLPKLKLLAYRDYAGVDRNDPLRFYYWPIIGTMYRRRVGLYLAQCSGGERILEVGFAGIQDKLFVFL